MCYKLLAVMGRSNKIGERNNCAVPKSAYHSNCAEQVDIMNRQKNILSRVRKLYVVKKKENDQPLWIRRTVLEMLLHFLSFLVSPSWLSLDVTYCLFAGLVRGVLYFLYNDFQTNLGVISTSTDLIDSLSRELNLNQYIAVVFVDLKKVYVKQ